MVAYSFKARFADQIARGEKRQTIRGPRKRHARAGEPIQLYCGMRTKGCRKLLNPDPICISVDAIRIWVPREYEPAQVAIEGEMGRVYVPTAFAEADGFESAQDFTRFWFDTHGPGLFEGVLIRWQPAGGA